MITYHTDNVNEYIDKIQDDSKNAEISEINTQEESMTSTTVIGLIIAVIIIGGLLWLTMLNSKNDDKKNKQLRLHQQKEN